MSDPQVQLSERELEILRLVATGATNQQIANGLGISVNTVKVHLRNVFGKIGAASRTEAALYAVRTGVISPEPDTAMQSVAVADDEPPEPVAAVTAAPVEERRSAPDRDRANTAMPAKSSARAREPKVHPLRRYTWPAGIALGVLLVALVTILLLQNAANPAPVASNGPQPVASVLMPNWTEHAALSQQFIGAAATSLNGSVFLIGGRVDGTPSDMVQRYDPGSDTWRPLAAKPTPVTDIQAVVLNSRIYVPGGETSDGAISDVLEVYDPQQGDWRTATSLPAPRSAYALAALEGRMYLFGGWDGEMQQADVFMYDPETDEWTPQTAMPTARAYSSAVTADGKMYVIGGENERGPLATNEQYNPVNEGRQPWSAQAPLLEPRSRFGMQSINNMVYIFGGVPDQAPASYDIRTDTWMLLQEPAPPQPLGVQPAVALRDASLFIISSDAEQTTSSTLEFKAVYMLTVPLQ